MSQRTWFITGVSSGFGRQLTEQLLKRGDRVVGTVRDTGKVADLIERYPEAFRAEVLDVTDAPAIREVVDRSFADLGRIRIYAKEPGKKPDFARPFVLEAGATVHDLARAVHKDIAENLRFARIWGHARFDGQQVDRHHVLVDRDVIELHA